ncbi:MAG: agmatinase [Marivirga sp.]|nr:agmatinase [Marivirga sp.]
MDSREDIVNRFDQNGPGVRGNLFGLPFSEENAQIIIVPAPWEVTVSYHSGTASAPQAILDASYQVDLYVKEISDAWKLGVAMSPASQNILDESTTLRALAMQHIARIENKKVINEDDPLLENINQACEKFNSYIQSSTKNYLKQGKIVGILGGDHSTPLGFIRALSEVYDRFGILQIDAHADLRKAYEGFTYSHASVMYNALKIPAVSKLIQVGIRDLCDEEIDVIHRAMGRVVTFFDADLKGLLYNGKSWESICADIIKQLPSNVYISFDIDGLDPKLCPNTGTPVAGGFEFQQIVYLIRKIVQSGKKIIGFDLSEIAPGESDWDANVGARMLFELCNWTAVSQGKLIAGK